MKKIVLYLFLICVIPLSAFAQKFPELNGKTLQDKIVTLPGDALGKYTLIGLSYNKKAEEYLRSWFDPVFDKFILKRGMFDDMYDVNIFFVPMFTGAKKVTYGKAFKEIKQRTDEELYSRVLFYKGEIKTYKESLGMGEKDMPYFFLLDPDGNIVLRFIGRFKERYFEEIEEILDKANE
jgi:hypothetical protein